MIFLILLNSDTHLIFTLNQRLKLSYNPLKTANPRINPTKLKFYILYRVQDYRIHELFQP